MSKIIMDYPPQQQLWCTLFLSESKNTVLSIIEIIQDMKKQQGIYLHTIPELVLKISTICHTQSKEIGLDNVDHLLTMIKLLLDTIIEVECILPDIEKSILEELINSSIDLLQYRLTEIKISCRCFFC
jgi:hypothetical protein